MKQHETSMRIHLLWFSLRCLSSMSEMVTSSSYFYYLWKLPVSLFSDFVLCFILVERTLTVIPLYRVMKNLTCLCIFLTRLLIIIYFSPLTIVSHCPENWSYKWPFFLWTTLGLSRLFLYVPTSLLFVRCHRCRKHLSATVG